MSDADKFDAIVIGAGPAGIACAYTLAREGRSVLVIERGTTAGSKNVTGGRLYTYALDLVEPGLWQEAALERRVTQERLVFLDGKRSINVCYQDPSFNEAGKTPQSYTILRSVFDEWFAAKAEEAGVILACGIKVDQVIEENGRIVGVKAGEDEMLAHIVVAADGVNSLTAQQAGMMPDIQPGNVAVGLKEIIELPSAIIEERFNLARGEGSAAMVVGCTEGIHGGGFLYTNRDSISLGCVFMPDEAARRGRQIHDIFQEFKMHPAICPLIEGGETAEYSAHLVNEGGYRGMPHSLYRDGLLLVGDAAGLVINTGYNIRGIDLAMASGTAAARAIISTQQSHEIGPRYLRELRSINVLPTMQAVDGYFDLLDIPRIYSSYPGVAAEMFSSLFKVTGDVPASIKKQIFPALKAHDISKWQLVKDAIRGYRSI